MLTSKQRAYLRSLAVNEDTILMMGKSGMSPELAKQADDALLVDTTGNTLEQSVQALTKLVKERLRDVL